MPIEAVSSINSIEQPKKNGATKVTQKTEPYPNDSVEFSIEKKKKMPFWEKTVISVGTFCAAFVGVGLLILKHQGNRIKKLYDEKLILSNLKENIVFKKANTVEEGIKFAKEELGIKEVDKNFTLEAINTANKGLVDVSNAHKGKVFMPHALKFTSPTDKYDYIAAVQMNINNPEFGNMYINKYYFDEKFLDEEIKKRLYNNKGPIFEFDSDMVALCNPVWDKYVLANPSKDLAVLIDSYYKDAKGLSIEQKRDLFYSLSYGKDAARRSFRDPLGTFKIIEKTQKEFLEKNKITINYDELSKLKYSELKDKLNELLSEMKKDGRYLIKNFEISSPIQTIYHEMGHLQDAAKNLKELDLKQWKFDWKGEWNSIRNKGKTGEVTNRVDVNEIDNRWGSVWDDEMKKLYIEKPEKFKKYYPDLYEFLGNKDIQQTAGKISSYSQTGIGEFIAETYARMISGKNISEEVMNLYRKYKGPELP